MIKPHEIKAAALSGPGLHRRSPPPAQPQGMMGNTWLSLGWKAEGLFSQLNKRCVVDYNAVREPEYILYY